MNYASEDLRNEHEGILFGLDILEKMTSLLSDNKYEIDDYRNIIEFLRLFADKCHHGKEEGLLFPEMEKYGIPQDNGPIKQMLAEHMEGRTYIAQMSESMSKNTINKNIFVDAAANYIKLLRNHIQKENNVLFPLGDKKIPMNEQKRLLELFEKHEIDVMGVGTHEKLHEMLNHFQNKYLK